MYRNRFWGTICYQFVEFFYTYISSSWQKMFAWGRFYSYKIQNIYGGELCSFKFKLNLNVDNSLILCNEELLRNVRTLYTYAKWLLKDTSKQWVVWLSELNFHSWVTIQMILNDEALRRTLCVRAKYCIVSIIHRNLADNSRGHCFSSTSAFPINIYVYTSLLIA